MKLRSSILFGCLLVVPLLAMFSHKIPRGFRDGFRDRVWRPAVDRATAWVGGEADRASQSADRPVVVALPESVQRPTVAATAARADLVVSPAPVAMPAPPTPAPAVLPAIALRSTPLPQPSRASLDGRLVKLGAVGLQVKPPDGAAGVHVASCRVSVDASGQLQRLFQANGPTPEVSLERLALQIEAWQSRVASRSAADGGVSGRDTTSPEPSSSGRFQ